MINVPILLHLEVANYGLYPGEPGASPGLNVNFDQGLTLILGANGLGKTTLINIMYRLLTGPFDIPALSDSSDLGTAKLEPKRLSPYERKTFANRVMDAAAQGTARLSFSLGSNQVIVERGISNLALSFLSVNGEAVALREDVFQTEIASLAGVWSFGDWILLLRHLVFYFEDRRALVWDPSAQRQILRFLFLPVADAEKWTKDEREILELESRMRNLNAVLGREEEDYTLNESKTHTAEQVREELIQLESLQRQDRQLQESLEEQLVSMETDRQAARLRLLQAQQDREGRFRELERAKLRAINARFPTQSETARYILAQLMTENKCLVCGHIAPTAAASYAERIKQAECVVCGTDLRTMEGLIPPSATADKQAERAQVDLQIADRNLETANLLLVDAEQAYDVHFKEIQRLMQVTSVRSNQIDSLIRRLPPDEAQLHQQRTDLAALRARVEQMRRDLEDKRRLYKAFVESVTRIIAEQSANVKRAFDNYAKGFLLEICNLTWLLQKARLGQTGDLIDFPAFSVALTGTDFPDPVRRTGPEQVSASQREFIDLAFRMALVAVAGNGGKGTLVIDAPESSLDAVFVDRASEVLSRFARVKSGNRLIITSNLVEGRLIPSLLENAKKGKGKAGIVDLFAIATPTMATRKLHDEYQVVRQKLLKGYWTR